MKFYIYELDERQRAIGDYLISCGHSKVENDDISLADVVVLPFNNVSNSVVIDNVYLNSLKNGAKVFTGVSDRSINEKFNSQSVELISFMNYKEIVIANSVPTAEGVLFYLLSEMKRTVFNSHILVIGFGICGSEIANKLKALNANVDILEVAEEKIALAKLNKFNNIGDSIANLKKYDAIINTVPLKVLDRNQIESIDKHTLIFDIASSPFGFEADIVKELEIHYKRILGLPSRFGVDYSGKILGDFILKLV